MTSPNPTQADENIEALKEINEELIKLANAIPVLSKDDILKHLNRIQDRVADLAQRAVGWHKLAQEKKKVIGNE